MNHLRNPTKSAILRRVIIARSNRKIYHYFTNLGVFNSPVGGISESRPLIDCRNDLRITTLTLNTPSVCPQG